MGHFLYLLRHSSLTSCRQVRMLGMKPPSWKKREEARPGSANIVVVGKQEEEEEEEEEAEEKEEEDELD